MHYILTRDMGYMLVTHIFLGVIYLVSKHSDNQVRIFHQISELSFDGGRIINSGKEIYKRKELVNNILKGGSLDENFGGA